jgi:hypothetical protein
MKKEMNKVILRTVKLIGLLVFILITAVACTKQPGYGGKSTIYGYVLEKKYSNTGQLESEYYLAEKRVYIVFGDDDFYSDEIRTDYTGKFKFSYLYAGDYTIYTYSECSPVEDCISDLKAIQLNVTILDNGDVVYTDDLVTENW